MVGVFCFFFKQKTAYEMRISDWSSDVCSSDLRAPGGVAHYMGGAVEGTGRLRQGVGAAIVAILGHVEKADRQQQRHGHQQEYDQAAPRPTRQGSRLAGFVLTTLVHSPRSEEHKSELQSLMRISSAVFCLKKKKHKHENQRQKTKTTAKR